MDHTRNVQGKAAALAKAISLAIALGVGTTSTATAALLIVNTDSTWLATNAQPDSTWNTDPLFDTTGWVNAYVVDSPVSPPDPCSPTGASCIWYDNQDSATQFAWLRKTFTVSDPISAAFLVGGIDDDGDIYVNGTLVYTDHNGFAEGALSNPLDLTAYLVQGVNLIAVAVEDNIPVWGQNHLFAAHLEIETSQAVPEPGSLILLASGLAGLAVLRRRKRQDWPTGARK